MGNPLSYLNNHVIGALAVTCGLVLAVPAAAADLATIGCVGDKIDQATRDQIASEVEHNLGLVGQRSSFSQPVMQAVNAAAAACAADHSWPVAAAEPAMLYTFGKYALPTVQRILIQRGLDPSALEALWFALPQEQRDKPLSVEAYRQLADAAIPDGPERTQANGILLHTFFEFESVMQSASVEFAGA